MDRRQFVAGAGVGAAAAASAFPTPAIAQGARELKMVTTWPKTLPGLQSGAERVAEAITSLSGGRLNVKVFAAGQLVGAFESFDAVSSGLADMYHSSEITWAGRSPRVLLLLQRSVRLNSRGDQRVDLLRRRSGAVG
jgi:TRAP-type mannitol/chloroaromatic compound transport system substrate-binding protein